LFWSVRQLNELQGLNINVTSISWAKFQYCRMPCLYYWALVGLLVMDSQRTLFVICVFGMSDFDNQAQVSQIWNARVGHSQWIVWWISNTLK
jgi:hypothetical protein